MCVNWLSNQVDLLFFNLMVSRKMNSKGSEEVSDLISKISNRYLNFISLNKVLTYHIYANKLIRVVISVIPIPNIHSIDLQSYYLFESSNNNKILSL